MPLTVPGALKRLGTPDSTHSSVRCDDTTCTKRFTDDVVYRRERDVYALNLPYVPRMVSHDDAARTLTVERVGHPLRDRWSLSLLHPPNTTRA